MRRMFTAAKEAASRPMFRRAIAAIGQLAGTALLCEVHARRMSAKYDEYERRIEAVKRIYEERLRERLILEELLSRKNELLKLQIDHLKEMFARTHW